MASGFDYGALWENARDVSDVLDALGGALTSLTYLRTSFYLPGLPPACRHGKRYPQPADYAERCARAIDTIRRVASSFITLLAEDRFVEPLANVWPPSAPKKLTVEFSHALVSARSFCFAARDSDEKKREDQKQNLYLAKGWVKAVLADLERRPDLAERAYQRARDKLPRRIPRASSEDGPVLPDRFRFQGKIYDGLAEKPFSVISYLWKQPNRTARYDELAEAIYGDREELLPDTAVSGLRQRINRFFREKSIPFCARERNGCLALCDGPPEPARPKTKPKSKKRGR